MKAVEGGVMILFRVSAKTRQDSEVVSKRVSLELCREWPDGFVNVDPLDIFACWCTYPCISPFVGRGWLIQKRFFWMLSAGQILMFLNMKYCPLRKKSLSWEEGAPKVFVCHCNSFRSGFWLKLFCNHFFSLCKVTKKKCVWVWICVAV